MFPFRRSCCVLTFSFLTNDTFAVQTVYWESFRIWHFFPRPYILVSTRNASLRSRWSKRCWNAFARMYHIRLCSFHIVDWFKNVCRLTRFSNSELATDDEHYGALDPLFPYSFFGGSHRFQKSHHDTYVTRVTTGCVVQRTSVYELHSRSFQTPSVNGSTASIMSDGNEQVGYSDPLHP